MARLIALTVEEVAKVIQSAGPGGISPDTLTGTFAGVSRSTLNRRLGALSAEGRIKALEQGRATRYVLTEPYLAEDIHRYFETDWQQRPHVGFRDELLLPISFVDFTKADYVTGMAAFYELNDTQIIQQSFIEGYVRSVIRGSDIPAGLRASGFKVEEVARGTREVCPIRSCAGA